MPEEKQKADVEALREMLREIEGKSNVGAPRRRAAVKLEEAVKGRVVETGRGPFYLIEQDADAFLVPEDDFTSVAELFFKRGQADRRHLERLDANLPRAAEADPGRLLFLDIETAGFHGTALFLVGLLVYEEGRFVSRQLFARNYAEEAAVLEYLRRYYDEAEILLTFNGRSFDIPFIADRAIVHRVELVRPEIDIDLLHVSRRVWKAVLPNCRLQTLERLVCGRSRTDDLPSHLIPEAYHEFVRTGDARNMADVIRHNAYDMITMAHLLARIATG